MIFLTPAQYKMTLKENAIYPITFYVIVVREFKNDSDELCNKIDNYIYPHKFNAGS